MACNNIRAIIISTLFAIGIATPSIVTATTAIKPCDCVKDSSLAEEFTLNSFYSKASEKLSSLGENSQTPSIGTIYDISGSIPNLWTEKNLKMTLLVDLPGVGQLRLSPYRVNQGLVIVGKLVVGNEEYTGFVASSLAEVSGDCAPGQSGWIEHCPILPPESFLKGLHFVITGVPSKKEGK